MKLLDAEKILDWCASYAIHYSDSDRTECCHIEEIYTLIQDNSASLYQRLEREFNSVTAFIRFASKNNMLHDRFQERHGRSIEMMMESQYMRDDRNFSALKHRRFGKSLMFVLIPTFNKELNILYEGQKLTEHSRNLRRNVVNRLRRELQGIWPNKGISVALFGSSENGLGSNNCDADICIITPEATNISKNMQQTLKKQRILPYNMYTIGNILNNMGMQNVQPIQNSRVPICKFYDPKTGLDCDINASNYLSIHNTRLIKTYVDLDKRVGPFLFAIKTFAKCRNINECKYSQPVFYASRFDTLSSYAYTLIGLHFLIACRRNDAVIPCLHNLEYICTSSECSHNYSKIEEGWEVRYHDCFQILNNSFASNIAKKYNGGLAYWSGHNDNDVGQLLKKFFKHFAMSKNLSAPMSIRALHGKPDSRLPESAITIQDPYIRNRNVAISCTKTGKKKILREFERAAKMLDNGHSFNDICYN